MSSRVVLIAVFVLIIAIWFSAFANACTPRGYGGFFGPSFGPPIFIGGGGWNRGGWDRSTSSNSGSSSPTSPAPRSPSRSSGGSFGGGGIRGGSGGK